MRHSCILIAVLGVCLGLSPKVYAAGSSGLRVETPEAGAFGKGSAFAGEANTSAAVYYNPAGLTQLKQAEVKEGFCVLQPMTDYDNPSKTDTTQMRRETFLIPHFYFAMPISDTKLMFGLGATSSWGTGTFWAEDSFSRYVATKSDLTNKDFMVTLAYPLTQQWSVGLSADWDDSKANLKKKIFQAGTGDDGDFQLKAKSHTGGYRLSTLYKFNEHHQAGLMYRSPMRHKFRGKLYLDGLNDNGTVPLQTIFGGPSYETEVSEEFVLPQSVIAGYSFKPNNKWTFNVDIEWFDWSSLEQERINFEDETDPTRLSVLNNGNPASRDWTGVWSEAIGAEYAMKDNFRVRGGYYHHQSTIPDLNVDSSIPEGNAHGFTTGFGYDFNPHATIDMAYSFIYYEPRKITNNIGASAGGNINGTYNQITNLVLGTFTYKF
jgi:long-chain fatty acid transport protein